MSCSWSHCLTSLWPAVLVIPTLPTTCAAGVTGTSTTTSTVGVHEASSWDPAWPSLSESGTSILSNATMLGLYASSTSTTTGTLPRRPSSGRSVEDVPVTPVGVGIGDIDSPPPTEVGEAPVEDVESSSLSGRDVLFAREVAKLVVAEVWHLLRLAGVVVDPPMRRAVSGGLGRASRVAPYHHGVLHSPEHTHHPDADAVSESGVAEHSGVAMATSLGDGLSPHPVADEETGGGTFVESADVESVGEHPGVSWDVAGPGPAGDLRPDWG